MAPRATRLEHMAIGRTSLAALIAGGLTACPVENEGRPAPASSAPFMLQMQASDAAPSPLLPPPPTLSLASASRATIGVRFEASRLFADTTYIPPDTMGAVGPRHIVEMINGNFEVFDKTGRSVRSRSLASFWTDIVGVAVQNGDVFDPRIVFDPASGRFFATSIDRDYGAGNNVYLARSDTSDPTGDWDGFRFAPDTEGAVQFHDFDTLAIDADGVYICTDDFPDSSALTGLKSCYSIPKADLVAALPTLANMTRFEESPPELPSIWGSFQPALDFGSSDGRAPLLGVAFGTPSYLLRANIFDAGAAGATLGDAETILGDPGHRVWGGARQPPPSTGRNWSIESRIGVLPGNVVQQGDSLWAAHTVQGSASNAAVRWYEIDEPTNTLLQTGLIDDPLQDFIYPSIAVNALGQVVIGYTCSGPSLAASSCVSVGETQAGVTEFDPPLLLRLGAGYYYQDYGTGRNRWGDFSATVIDPADPCAFWTFQEFVAEAAHGLVGPPPLSGGGRWGTAITELRFVSCWQPPVEFSRNWHCGLGPELAFLMPLLFGTRRARRLR